MCSLEAHLLYEHRKVFMRYVSVLNSKTESNFLKIKCLLVMVSRVNAQCNTYQYCTIKVLVGFRCFCKPLPLFPQHSQQCHSLSASEAPATCRCRGH